MNLIEQEVQRSLADLMVVLHKEQRKESTSAKGTLLSITLQTLVRLGSALSAKGVEEGTEQAWQEYQDVVEVTKTGYTCNSLGWSKLLPSLILLYLESDETFKMFDTKIREAAVTVIRAQIRKNT